MAFISALEDVPKRSPNNPCIPAAVSFTPVPTKGIVSSSKLLELESIPLLKLLRLPIFKEIRDFGNLKMSIFLTFGKSTICSLSQLSKKPASVEVATGRLRTSRL